MAPAVDGTGRCLRLSHGYLRGARGTRKSTHVPETKRGVRRSFARRGEDGWSGGRDSCGELAKPWTGVPDGSLHMRVDTGGLRTRPTRGS